MKRKLLFAVLAVVALAIGGYYAFPRPVAEFLIGQARSHAGLSRKSIQVDDHSIVYLEGGAGPQTIVLLHGFSGNKDNWLRFAPYLKDYHVVIPDLPGQGESSKLISAKYDLSSQVDRLHKFAAGIGIRQFHLVGNSMGGLLAGAYAVRYPGEVVSLGLFGAAGVKSPQPSEAIRMFERGENPVLINDEDDFDRLVKLVFVDPPATPYPLRKVALETALANRAIYKKVLGDIGPDANSLQQDLPKIQAPTFILWGAQDRLLDVSSVSVFEQGLQRHQTLVIEQCGHVPMIEKPQVTADAYRAFIKSLGN